MPEHSPFHVCFSLPGGTVAAFEQPLAVLVAEVAADVMPLLEEVERATARGWWAAGFLAYEAAGGLDPALVTAPPGDLPLAWFVLCTAPRRRAGLASPSSAGAAPRACSKVAGAGTGSGLPPLVWDWQASLSPIAHARGVAAVREAIARGDTYQTNLTWRLRAPFASSPSDLFANLLAAQPVGQAAYVDSGRHVLCSASPELFFQRRGRHLLSRPMKGTAPRGRYPLEDERFAAALAASPKERAENLMIVDMVRNDLARVARRGSVAVPRLCQLERYATVWQLTSTVTADSAAPLPELMQALFPAASITGAPKTSTMRLIAALEDSPRGPYTGAIGWVGPGGRARFNVAIRTAWVDRERGRVEYGTGGGVTWDSDAASELAESRLKAALLLAPRPSFELLETLRWRDRRRGYWLLREHLARLRASARHFDFPCPQGVERELLEFGAALPAGAHRVRLCLRRTGRIALEAAPLSPPRRGQKAGDGRLPWRVALAPEAVEPDALLFHKTTRRERFERARAARPGCDDVLLWNREGELTESTVANLIVRLAGRLVTPPVECGLLAGTLRARLLARGMVSEAVVRVADLERIEGMWLVNSVRGWVPARLVESSDPEVGHASTETVTG